MQNKIWFEWISNDDLVLTKKYTQYKDASVGCLCPNRFEWYTVLSWSPFLMSGGYKLHVGYGFAALDFSSCAFVEVTRGSIHLKAD